MIGFYILGVLLFPLAALWGAAAAGKPGDVLLDRGDTLYLRGLGACMVVLAHSCAVLNVKGCEVNSLVDFAMNQLGGIGVLIFFFASGYGICESYGNKPANYSYLIKRGGGIYVPYLLIKLVLLAIGAALNGGEGLGMRRLLSVLLIEEDWFVHVIMVQYIVFWVLWKFLGRKRLVLGSAVADCLLSVLYILMDKPDRWVNGLWLFTFGMWCSMHKTQIKGFFARRRWGKIILCGAGFAGLGLVFALYKGAGWANLVKPVSGFFLCGGLCGLMQAVSFRSPAMQWFGKRSLHLYVVHVYVMESGMWGLAARFGTIPLLWTELAVSLALTEILYRATGVVTNQINRTFIKELP